MSTPIVLLYNLDDSTELGRAVRRVCILQHLRIRGVLPPEQAKPPAQLLGRTAEHTAAGEPPREGLSAPVFNEPMLVLAGLSDAQLSRLLKALRPLPPLPLKAVLTADNAGWTGTRLHEELRREHEALAAGKEPPAHA